MNDPNLTIWEFLEENLDKSISCALLIVVESEGSSPGRVGFKMAVNDKKEMSGSIGGGIMEVKIVEKVFKTLQGKSVQTQIIKQEHSKQSALNQSGMICSGFQTILILEILPENLETIIIIKQSIQKGNIVYFSIKHSDNKTRIATDLSSTATSAIFTKESEDIYSYQEPLGIQETVVIIGGGHCSLALSELLHWLNFKVQIIETRPHINTLTSNTFIHNIEIIDSYEDIMALLADRNSFIVVMTVGYRQDMSVLSQILGRGYRYIGVLGSKKKIETIKSTLSKEYPSFILTEMQAPIGLDISSKTPREIAVSIAGQIIELKNRI